MTKPLRDPQAGVMIIPAIVISGSTIQPVSRSMTTEANVRGVS